MLLFGQRNPQPVPLLDVTEPGAVSTVLAPGADLRTDLPRYRVWRDGVLVDEPTDVADLWADDLVSFLIGCSFSFETALLDAGVPVRNIEQDRNVSMYRTNVECRPAGRLSGPLVVSMRPVPAAQVVTAVQVTARMPERARRSRARGRAGVARHRRSRAARLRGPCRGAARRRTGVLGMRRDPAGCADGVQAAVRDHPRAWLHVRHRRTRRGLQTALTDTLFPSPARRSTLGSRACCEEVLRDHDSSQQARDPRVLLRAGLGKSASVRAAGRRRRGRR